VPDLTEPQRITLSRRRRLPPGAKSVARPHKWGNPYKVAPHGPYTLAESIERYRCDLLAGRLVVTVEDARRELAGRDLACWCKPGEPCHADVLIEVANSSQENELPVTDVAAGGTS
jgi:hypothetical protein